MYYGMSRTLNSTLSTRAAITLAAITGNIGLSGGGASIPQITPSIVLNEQGVACPPGAPGVKTLPGSRSSIRGWKQIREGKPYPIKVLFNSYRNDLQCDGHVEGYREIFKEIDLLVVIDIFMTRSAQYADIVLPEATIYERDDLVTATDYLQRMEKAIEPLYETKPALEIWSEIARRVGLGEYFQQGPRDYMRVLLNSRHPSVSGISLERLEKEKIVRGNVPFPPEIPFARKEFPTPSGRIEFYNELLVEFGQELPIHQETLESPLRSLLAKQYPLTFLTAKVRGTTHSVMANVDWMKEVSSKPTLDMNPIDAEKRGIRDGDPVVAFNNRGKVKLKARLNEAVRPGVVNVPHGWWPEQFAEGHYSDLLHRMDDLSIIDPVLEKDFVIRDSRACSGLIHYDCLAEVQKA
jgi:molybdopterin-containing oxidoreductase family molybdopterin binding subunit